MKRLLIAALGSLALALVALGGFAATPQALAQEQQGPDCSALGTPDKTIYVYSSPVIIMDTGVIEVVGRANAPNMISTPYATRACIVGGTRADTLSGGNGDDIIIGNGATSGRDFMSGHGGNDVCYGPGTLISCSPPGP